MHREPSHYPSIPGTTPSPRGLFVDLWGTLCAAPKRGYARSFQEVDVVAGAADALFRATRAGWLVYLLGNEEAVARGRVSIEDWTALEEAIVCHLAERGARVQRSYVCVDDPVQGVPGRRKDSVYLLPNTGAFYHAAHVDKVELRRSWVVGDSTLEIVAGWRAGVRQVGLRSGLGLSDRTFEVEPDFVADDLTQALGELLALESALHP